MRSYREIAREIERRIKTGVYSPGSPLPPRLELMNEFGVARATLDRAIQELTLSKRVSSRRGAGTFVNPAGEHRMNIAFVGNPSMELRAACRLPNRILLPQALEGKSNWPQLYAYDGILWYCPDSSQLPIIQAMHGKIPQVIVNRTIPGFDCVSTDHRGAYHEITAERLAAHPDAIPIFLHQEKDSLPTQYRFEGFSDACRSAGVFYELWRLPQEFTGKCAELHRRLAQLPPDRILLLFADSLSHTGAVMRIAAEQQWRWGENRFYSDFDDNYPPDVWGVVPTSFLQNYIQLVAVAADELERQITSGGGASGKLRLQFPCRRNGNT